MGSLDMHMLISLLIGSFPGIFFASLISSRVPNAALRYVLRVRGFRRLWLVLGVASLGDWIGLLATALFASSQVRSSAAKGAAFGGTIAVLGGTPGSVCLFGRVL